MKAEVFIWYNKLSKNCRHTLKEKNKISVDHSCSLSSVNLQALFQMWRKEKTCKSSLTKC